MRIEEKSHCAIDYNPTMKCVIQTWSGFAGSQNFRASILKTIDVFKEYDVTSIISNTQQSEVVKKADADWVAAYANPILMQHGLRRIAFVVPESILGQWSVEHFMQETTEQDLKMQYFDNLNSAQTWISQTL